jgi:cyclase
MKRIARIIPCLLLSDRRLVKTVRFSDPLYIGDPVNAVKIFNEKEVDELVVLDISASRQGRQPDFALIEEMAGEAFMPVTYGGGIRAFDDVRQLIRCGVEKIAVNEAATMSTDLIRDVVSTFGRQAVVGVVDVKRNFFGAYRATFRSGTRNVRAGLIDHVLRLQEAGIGELLVNDVDRDGTQLGYDMQLFRKIVDAVDIPVVACGGARSLENLREVVLECGVDGAAAGSLFVFHGKHRAVLITYPSGLEIEIPVRRLRQ